jgi:nicotinate-nucleotide adenylyltransferase
MRNGVGFSGLGKVGGRIVSRVELGVYGGSFDPPHIAHALAVNVALGMHGLERVLIVPTYAHAFNKQLSSFDDRLHMCELAFQHLRPIEICPIERELPTPSLTLHTLQALAKRHPDAQLRLLVGADIVTETHAWHDFAAVERLAPLLVIERQGFPPYDPAQPALPPVSSSEIRRRLRAGESTRGWLSPSVEQYIRERGLYPNP